MTREELNDWMQEYIYANPDAWIGIHDTHHIGISSKIEVAGLNVSHSPYGRKVRRFKDENGKIDASKNFKATMFHLTSQQGQPLIINPVDPVIINIHPVILSLFEYDCTNPDAFKDFCLYGIEQPPTTCDETGEVMHGDSSVVSKPDEANVRILPSYFIAGHIDMETGTFIENPNYFLNLSKDEKDKIYVAYAKLARKRFEQESENE